MSSVIGWRLGSRRSFSSRNDMFSASYSSRRPDRVVPMPVSSLIVSVAWIAEQDEEDELSED